MRKIDNYWVNTGDIRFVEKLLKNREINETIQLLLSKHNPSYQYDLRLSLDDFILFNEFLKSGENDRIKGCSVKLFCKYLFPAGYLSIIREPRQNLYSVQILNKEIKSLFAYKLLNYYNKLYEIDDEFFLDVKNDLAEIFHSKNPNKLKNSVEKLLKQCPEFVKIKGDAKEEGFHRNEDLIHSIINYISLELNQSISGSEAWFKRECRAEILVVNLSSKTGMMVELKYEGCQDRTAIQPERS